MDKTIRAVVSHLDLGRLRDPITRLADREEELQRIQSAIDEAGVEVGFLDKINVSKTTEAEKEVKRRKAEYDGVQREATVLRAKLRTEIQGAIQREPQARILIQLGKLESGLSVAHQRMGQLATKGARVESSNPGETSAHAMITRIERMGEALGDCHFAFEELARVLYDDFDVEKATVTEDDLVDAVLEEMRRHL